ncbi:MAG: ComEC/Rec2 family competence protein [Candidatus Berkelbacteria bacterium]|nr:ComEC/Rec2 family competence protein [Candidatus Berkelbacteria bacterium]
MVFSPSKILFYLCISVIIGVFVRSIFLIPQPYVLGFLFIGVILIFISFVIRENLLFIRINPVVIGFCLVFFLLGVCRYQSVDSNLHNSGLEQYNQKEIALVGRVISEPDVRENATQLTVGVEKILYDKKIIFVSGKILVGTNKYPSYNYADIVEVTGLLKTPEAFEGFDYQNYLAKKGIFSVIDWPEVKILSKENYSNVFQFSYGQLLKFKNNIRENINKSFSFVESKLLAGILLGDQSSFSQDFKDKLNITGLRHITAVSGMNVAILCSVLMSLFLGLGLWRGQAFYLTLFFIFLFVLMIGFQASVIRAGIMGSVVLLAQKVGRLPNSTRIIVLTAAIMVLINPMILVWDVGFQLSFLAILGIVLLTEPFNNLLKFIPQEKFINLRSVISATLSAQVFTLPILIYNFGRISLISTITNILVVPMVDLIMIFGFIFALLSSVWWVLGWVFIWPCWLLLAYVIKVINIFSKPWAIKSFENVHWLWLVILYLILAGVVIWVKRRARLKFLDY